jgi:phosphoglucomutase
MPEIPPNKFYSNIAISFKLANDEAKNEAKQSTKQIARQKEANDNMIKLAKIDASKILAKHMTKSVNRILGTTAKAKGIKTRRKKGRKTRRI